MKSANNVEWTRLWTLEAMNGAEFISVRQVSLLRWRREESQVNKPVKQGFTFNI